MKFIIEGFPNEKLINYRRNKIEIHKDDVYVTDIGYFPETKMHKVERTEGISENIICFCTKGKGYVQIDNAVREIKSNEYFIIPKGKSHKYFSGVVDGWGLYFVHLSGSKADEFCIKQKKFSNDLPPAQLNLVYNIFYNSIKSLEINANKENVVFVNKSINYIIEALTNFETNKTAYTSRDATMFKFLNYLETNISKKISIYSLIDELDVSQGTLYSIVKEKYGVTPMQYVFDMKVNIAADLLNTTNMKITNIAHKVGFEDQYHFSKKFKKITGMSPREYRKQNV